MKKNDLLPLHIRNIAVNVTADNKTIHCRLKCTCGCQTFSVYQSENEETPFEIYEKSLKFPVMGLSGANKNGRSYIVWETFFHIPIGKRYVDELYLPNGKLCYSDIIKIRCAECGNEYIIFDGDRHGYDALNLVINDLTRPTRIQNHYDNQKFKTLRKCCGVEVAIKNDNSYAEIQEIFKGHGLTMTPEQYANAFSWFTVCSAVNGKTRVIFDIETS